MICLLNCDALLKVIVTFQKAPGVPKPNSSTPWRKFNGINNFITIVDAITTTERRLKFTIDSHVVEMQVVNIGSTDKIVM